MFTQRESACIALVFSISPRLLTSPFAFKRESVVQEAPRHKEYLRALFLGLFACEILATLFTLSTTIATKAILYIIGQSMYIVIRVGVFLTAASIHFYRHEVQELINQTLKMNSDFGRRFLGRSELPSKRREDFFCFLYFVSTTTIAFSQIIGLFLTFFDLPFTVYPGSEVLRGNIWIHILMAGIRVGFFLEEAGYASVAIVGIFCMTSTLFWLKKTW